MNKFLNKVAYGLMATVTAVGFYFGAVYNEKGLNPENKAKEVKPKKPSNIDKRKPIYICEAPYIQFDGWDCRNEKYISEAIKSDSPLLEKFNRDRKYWYAFFRTVSVMDKKGEIGKVAITEEYLKGAVKSLEKQAIETNRLYPKSGKSRWSFLTRKDKGYRNFKKHLNKMYPIYFPKKK